MLAVHRTSAAVLSVGCPWGGTCQAPKKQRHALKPFPVPAHVPMQTGLVDYEALEQKALDYRPKLIICGGSAYTREWDYKRFREIADKVCLAMVFSVAAALSQ